MTRAQNSCNSPRIFESLRWLFLCLCVCVTLEAISLSVQLLTKYLSEFCCLFPFDFMRKEDPTLIWYCKTDITSSITRFVADFWTIKIPYNFRYLWCYYITVIWSGELNSTWYMIRVHICVGNEREQQVYQMLMQIFNMKLLIFITLDATCHKLNAQSFNAQCTMHNAHASGHERGNLFGCTSTSFYVIKFVAFLCFSQQRMWTAQQNYLQLTMNPHDSSSTRLDGQISKANTSRVDRYELFYSSMAIAIWNFIRWEMSTENVQFPMKIHWRHCDSVIYIS